MMASHFFILTLCIYCANLLSKARKSVLEDNGYSLLLAVEMRLALAQWFFFCHYLTLKFSIIRDRAISLSISAQISPRILSAFERLEQAVDKLQKASDSQKDKVNASEVEALQSQLEGLKQDNLALSEALEAYSEADYDTQFEELNDKIGTLREENEALQGKNASLQNMNSDFSDRLERLIGNVEQVLEEGDD